MISWVHQDMKWLSCIFNICTLHSTKIIVKREKHHGSLLLSRTRLKFPILVPLWYEPKLSFQYSMHSGGSGHIVYNVASTPCFLDIWTIYYSMLLLTFTLSSVCTGCSLFWNTLPFLPAVVIPCILDQFFISSVKASLMSPKWSIALHLATHSNPSTLTM